MKYNARVFFFLSFFLSSKQILIFFFSHATVVCHCVKHDPFIHMDSIHKKDIGKLYISRVCMHTRNSNVFVYIMCTHCTKLSISLFVGILVSSKFFLSRERVTLVKSLHLLLPSFFLSYFFHFSFRFLNQSKANEA